MAWLVCVRCRGSFVAESQAELDSGRIGYAEHAAVCPAPGFNAGDCLASVTLAASDPTPEALVLEGI